MKRATPVNKVNRQSITIFHYYLNTLLPPLIKELTPVPKRTHQYSVNHRHITYHYQADVAQITKNIRPETFLSAAKSVYLDSLACRTGDYSGLKQTNCTLKMIPLSAQITDHIDLVMSLEPLTDQQHKQRQDTRTRNYTKTSRTHLFNSPHHHSPPPTLHRRTSALKEGHSQLYIIHRARQPANQKDHQWLNFIQRYRFVKCTDQDGEPLEKIVHQVIFTHNQPKGIFSWDQSHRILQRYLQIACPLNKNGKSLLLTQILAKVSELQLVQAEQLKQTNKNLSYHPSHRRSLKLPAQHKPMLSRLLSRAQTYFKQLNPCRKPKGQIFLEQLTCRMMDNHDYKEEKAWGGITYYLDMEKRLREQYTWDDFREFREMKFYDYLGKDKMGRPIIYNRIRNTLMSQMKDKNKLSDFHLYFFQIFMQDQMQGWVDTYDGISDAADQVNDNTDLLFTKKLLTQLHKMSLGRCANIVVFNMGMLGKLFVKMVYPLFPESFCKILNFYDSDEQTQLMVKLRQLMSNDVIPVFLGGNNDIDSEHSYSKEGGYSSQNTQNSSSSRKTKRY